jgi:hypothetical protein
VHEHFADGDVGIRRRAGEDRNRRELRGVTLPPMVRLWMAMASAWVWVAARQAR